MTDNNLMDNMWEIFKIRVEALQNINPKMFVDNQKPVSFLSNLEKDGPGNAKNGPETLVKQAGM